MNDVENTAVAAKPWMLAGTGELWALGAVLGYAAANTFEGSAVRNADPLIGPLIRGLPSIALGVVLLLARRTYRQLQPGSPQFVGKDAIIAFIVPGVLATIGLFTYFFALRMGGVVITIPVQQTYILWGALASRIYLGERFSAKSLMGVAILMAGSVMLAFGRMHGTPVSGDWYYAIPLAVFTAMAFGVSGVFWRLGQLRGADQSTGIFLQSIASEVIAVIGLLWFGRLDSIVKTSAHDLGALFAGGVLSGIVGLYCVFTSLRLMTVTRAYALLSLTPLAATLFAYLFLKEDVNFQMMTGVLMTCLGVAIVQVYKPKEVAKSVQRDSVEG